MTELTRFARKFVPCLNIESPEFCLCTSNFNTQQDRQCTYNVALRRVRATILVAGKQ
jgi:hypothetical protein